MDLNGLYNEFSYWFEYTVCVVSRNLYVLLFIKTDLAIGRDRDSP
jgi:hypothetical protein